MQVSRRLVVKKEIPIDNSKDLIVSMDVAMAEYYCKNNNFERGLEIYREVIPGIYDNNEKNTVTNQYINYALQYAQKLYAEKKYIEAIEQYRDLMKYSGFPVSIYKNIGLCMKSIGNADLAIKFLKRFEEISPDNYTYIPSQENIIPPPVKADSVDNYTYIPSSDCKIQPESAEGAGKQKRYIPSQEAANISKTFDNSGIQDALARAQRAEDKALKILAGNFEGMQ